MVVVVVVLVSGMTYRKGDVTAEHSRHHTHHYTNYSDHRHHGHQGRVHTVEGTFLTAVAVAVIKGVAVHAAGSGHRDVGGCGGDLQFNPRADAIRVGRPQGEIVDRVGLQAAYRHFGGGTAGVVHVSAFKGDLRQEKMNKMRRRRRKRRSNEFLLDTMTQDNDIVPLRQTSMKTHSPTLRRGFGNSPTT